MSEPIRVLTVDDQPLIRMGFRLILEAETDLEVVGEAANGEEAIDRAAALGPDVILMDVRMPVLDGIAATRRILDARPGIRILVLTTFDLDEYAFAALRAGASGFLLKDAHARELVAAIRAVHQGDAVTSPRITRRMLEMFGDRLPATASGAPDPALTDRERDVLLAMASGLSNTEIAAQLFVTESTVKTHVGRVLAKIGARDRVHAVIYAYENGIVR
ncbi:response regulator transcription factor [Microbacterium sp. CFBP9034]|uniref:response regulator transcription factor n=1 Tax=Microbacterium sp. CFBP9034 TaxID=3096540 RepID=UPI002A6AF160|nr:response regulator transcription factor [Microbacterium sp. CFBP9034]MDY0909571.1 response regulator transcription factor [Microbacterium sp. CFBP9034]